MYVLASGYLFCASVGEEHSVRHNSLRSTEVLTNKSAHVWAPAVSSATVPDLLGLPAKELLAWLPLVTGVEHFRRTLAFPCRYVRIIERPPGHEGEANPSIAVRTMGTDTATLNPRSAPYHFLPALRQVPRWDWVSESSCDKLSTQGSYIVRSTFVWNRFPSSAWVNEWCGELPTLGKFRSV